MSSSTTVHEKSLTKAELAKYEYTPIYMYTEKDSLNRITVLKEIGKETYLVAGRYSGTTKEDRLYRPLTEEERLEVQKLLKIKSRDSIIIFL
jgi:hypothetical protein